MFDWQTEDDGAWEALPNAQATADAAPRRRWWPLLGVVLLGMSALLVYYAVTQRAENATAVATEALLASHDVLTQAAAAGDGELFITVLSGRSSGWADAQQRLLHAEALWGREALGLRLLPDVAPPPQVTVAPNLQQAEVVVERAYATADGTDGAQTAVRLRHTAVYRRGVNRWLLAPPDAAFWGETLSAETRHLRVSYPARDEAAVAALLAQLDETVARVCRLDGEPCPATWRLTLRFTTDPTSLLTATVPGALVDERPALTLPTPSLVGVPANAAGYRALHQAYAAPLAAAALGRRVGWTCCAHGLFYQALIDWQLAEWGLRPWPLTATQYDNVLASKFSLAGIRPFWSRGDVVDDFNHAWPVYTLVAYVAERGTQTPLALMRNLAGGDYERWLWQALGGRVDSFAALEQDWWFYAHGHSNASEPPVLTVRP